MTFTRTIGWLGSILLALCALPEVIRTIHDKTSYIGWGMLATWGIGELLLLIYIILRKEYPLIINYSFNLILILILIYYKI